MDRSRSLFFLIALIAVAGFGLTACDSGTQEPDAPAAEALELSGSGSTGAESAGASAIPASRFPELAEGVIAGVPDNFPTDMPIYPGSAPAQGKGVEIDGAPMSAVQLLTTDPPTKVYDYYVDQLGAAGWTMNERENLGNRGSIMATNGECSTTLLIIPSDDGGSDIFIINEC